MLPLHGVVGSTWSGGRPPPASISPHRLARRAAAGLAACAGASLGGAPPAGAVAGMKRPAQVQRVLEHLKQHPMTVTSLPMQYDAEPTTPLPECVVGLTPEDVLPPSGPGAEDQLRRQHAARVIAGLLYVACGGLDQAHNLVTPLCWGSWTPYAGEPISGSAAAADAAYVHALVHRQEGRAIGEFGDGFRNAVYWYRAAGEHPIQPELLKAAQSLARGRPACEEHVARHGGRWSPSRFVDLCSDVAASRDPDRELVAFCEGVMAREFELLLDHCYSKL